MLIEIFADLVCPWCYIGRHRLRRALAERPGLKTVRSWQPFQINPDMPPGGMDRTLYLAAKFGGAERAHQLHDIVEETAERDGLPLALDRIRCTPNTLDAHRLVRFADRAGLAEALVDALFGAYFIEGLDIGDRDVLAVKATDLGLAPDAVRTLLNGQAETATVRASDTRARHYGLQAVPCFIFDRRYALAGAQEPVAFLPLLDLAQDNAALADAMVHAHKA